MQALTFIVLFIIFQLLIQQIAFVKRSELGGKMLALLFSVKVIAGLSIGWISYRFYPVNDYWDINTKSMLDHGVLMNDPKKFIADLFFNPYHDNYGRFFNAVGSYWNDLRNNIVIKLLAIFNIYSKGNYYINSLFFNFIGFFGCIALYRVFSNIYPGKKGAIIIGAFLLPSTLYFTSGVHKDLLIATFLSLYIYSIHFISLYGKTVKKIILLVISSLMILLLRNFLFILLFYATVIYFFCKKTTIRPLKIFILAALTGIFMLWFTEFVFNFHPLKIITQRQFDFLQLEKAGSQLPISTLDPNIKSFIVNLPQAFSHSFLKPLFWENSLVFSNILSIEWMCYIFIFILFLYQNFKFSKYFKENPIVVLGVFISISMLLITGFIVPNLGSIVRYKSIYLPFLIIPILVNINIRLKK